MSDASRNHWPNDSPRDVMISSDLAYFPESSAEIVSSDTLLMPCLPSVCADTCAIAAMSPNALSFDVRYRVRSVSLSSPTFTVSSWNVHSCDADAFIASASDCGTQPTIVPLLERRVELRDQQTEHGLVDTLLDGEQRLDDAEQFLTLEQHAVTEPHHRADADAVAARLDELERPRPVRLRRHAEPRPRSLLNVPMK
jgi:hypothetical protein